MLIPWQLFLATYTIMQFTLLVLWALTSATKSRATVPAAALAFVDSICLCLLSHLEHMRSVSPSVILNVYLLLTLPFDVARSRTLWLAGDARTISTVFSSALSVKLLILVTEAIEKRDILLSRYQHSSPEVTSGIYSRSFFWWLNTLMRTGFKRVISNDDLYPIDDSMTSASLKLRAQSTWVTADKTARFALFRSTMRALGPQLAMSIFPRLCLIALKYSQPFLISRTIQYSGDLSQPEAIGWSLTAAFGLVFFSLAVANGAYWHSCYRFVTSMRGCLVSQIYSKTLDLSITALDESVALTLMATDTETICESFRSMHELWAVPVEAAIAIFLLYCQLGLAFLGPTITAAGIHPLNSLAMYLTNVQHNSRNRRRVWNLATHGKGPESMDTRYTDSCRCYSADARIDEGASCSLVS